MTLVSKLVSLSFYKESYDQKTASMSLLETMTSHTLHSSSCNWKKVNLVRARKIYMSNSIS